MSDGCPSVISNKTLRASSVAPESWFSKSSRLKRNTGLLEIVQRQLSFKKINKPYIPLNLQHKVEGSVCVGKFSHLGLFPEEGKSSSPFKVIEVKNYVGLGWELNCCKLEKKKQNIINRNALHLTSKCILPSLYG